MVVHLDQVAPIELPRGSWSKVLISRERVDGNVSALGFSTFTAGTETAPVSHSVEELAYVTRGSGELRLDGGAVRFDAGDALFIPAGIWHAVVNTGDGDMSMVFTFPHPDYPPTDRRSESAG